MGESKRKDGCTRKGNELVAPCVMETQQMKNEKGHFYTQKHKRTHMHRGLCHTNDHHYSLQLKGRGELDSVVPFTKICPSHVVILYNNSAY